jgi:glycosyltransferase involved in cell wall biosynthesis
MTASIARPRILVICDYYLPGFESGGAMRTLVNMVDRLSDRFDFCIVTRDHDGPLDRTPYQTVKIDDWNEVGSARVFYLSRANIGLRRIRKIVAEVGPDIIYVNSFFSPLTVAVLTLRRLGRLDRTPVVLAPEGEFSPGALTVRSLKKALYLRIAKSLHLLQNVIWKTASETEADDVRRLFPSARNIFVAPNLPPRHILAGYDQGSKPEKHPGRARFVFLSRYARKKNFNWLLELLSGVQGALEIDIWGPIEDPDYWKQAQELMADLPPNIRLEYCGTVRNEDVPDTLFGYHFFVLPTLGENFGHVFIEALAAGCPILVSDRTPWRQLVEKRVGWDIPLESPDAWISAINDSLRMGDDEFGIMSRAARQFAAEWLASPDLDRANVEVLHRALAAGSQREK